MPYRARIPSSSARGTADREIVDPHHHLWDRPDSRYLAEELVPFLEDDKMDVQILAAQKKVEG